MSSWLRALPTTDLEGMSNALGRVRERGDVATMATSRPPDQLEAVAFLLFIAAPQGISQALGIHGSVEKENRIRAT